MFEGEERVAYFRQRGHVFIAHMKGPGGPKVYDYRSESYGWLSDHERAQVIEDAIKAVREYQATIIPCGGCGESDEANRCIGCLHNFKPS